MKEKNNILDNNIKNFVNSIKSHGVIIKNEEKFINYINDKSLYRYQQIFNELKLYECKLTDDNFNDFYRYDLRVRRLLFKLLTAFEIKLRANVLNKEQDNHKNIEELDFGSLIKKHYQNDKNLIGIKNMRNKVMHHQLIQLNNDIVLTGMNNLFKIFRTEKFAADLNKLSIDLKLINEYQIKEGSVIYEMGIKEYSK